MGKGDEARQLFYSFSKILLLFKKIKKKYILISARSAPFFSPSWGKAQQYSQQIEWISYKKVTRHGRNWKKSAGAYIRRL